MTLTANGQNSDTNFNNTIGIMVKTGPVISIFDKNFIDTFDLFHSAREDGIGIFYGFNKLYFNTSITKMIFKGGPIEDQGIIIGNYYSGSKKIANQQSITFESISFDINYYIDIAYLNAGIDLYQIKEKFVGLEEEYLEYSGQKINNKIGGHLGFGIKYNYTISHFVAEPFMGVNYFYIDGTCKGIRSDFYLRGGFKIDFGLIIGFRI